MNRKSAVWHSAQPETLLICCFQYPGTLSVTDGKAAGAEVGAAKLMLLMIRFISWSLCLL